MKDESKTTNMRRNLNPCAEAIAAMWLFGKEYAAQKGGSMDFWDGLSKEKKRSCTSFVNQIKSAHRADQ